MTGAPMLAPIIAYKAAEVAALRASRTVAQIEAEAAAAPPVRPFLARLRAVADHGAVPLIAEIKRASPSRGLIRAECDPAALARAYAAAGAACLSVLTDTPSFGGSNAHFRAARAACALPALRKDFIIDPLQVIEARAIGADCVLAIMAAIDDALAGEICAVARQLGMDVLVEVHDAAELERASALPLGLLGINNRDLDTFETRLETTEQLAPLAPDGVMLVAESGIASPADIRRLERAGARAFLIGESLMRAADIEDATRRLLLGARQDGADVAAE